MPAEPDTLAAAGLTDGEVEALVLKALNSRAEATGRHLSDHLKLAFRMIDPLLHSMKHDRLVAHKGAAMMNDYVYQLTELGRERAKKFAEHCTYFGAAPVPLARVHRKRQAADARRSASDGRRFAPRVRGPADRQEACCCGSARRSTRAAACSCSARRATARRASPSGSPRRSASTIWIPRAIGIDGEIMRLFDPGMHEEMPLPANEGLIDQRKIDHRWVRIRRPTIVVGGELTMDQLEVTLNTVDEHQRSAAATEEQLRHAGDRRLRPAADDDRPAAQSLDRAAGKAVRLPEPGQRQEDSGAVRPVDRVLDEPGAEGPGGRRVPAAYSVQDRSHRPDENAFRELFKIMAPKLGVEYDEDGGRIPDRNALPGGRTGRSAAASRATCCCRFATICRYVRTSRPR